MILFFNPYFCLNGVYGPLNESWMLGYNLPGLHDAYFFFLKFFLFYQISVLGSELKRGFGCERNHFLILFPAWFSALGL